MLRVVLGEGVEDGAADVGRRVQTALSALCVRTWEICGGGAGSQSGGEGGWCMKSLVGGNDARFFCRLPLILSSFVKTGEVVVLSTAGEQGRMQRCCF